MNNEIVATYHVGAHKYYLYVCYSNSQDETPEFYDLYNIKGHCLNEGDPFWDVPSPMELQEYIKNHPYITE